MMVCRQVFLIRFYLRPVHDMRVTLVCQGPDASEPLYRSRRSDCYTSTLQPGCDRLGSVSVLSAIFVFGERAQTKKLRAFAAL